MDTNPVSNEILSSNPIDQPVVPQSSFSAPAASPTATSSIPPVSSPVSNTAPTQFTTVFQNQPKSNPEPVSATVSQQPAPTIAPQAAASVPSVAPQAPASVPVTPQPVVTAAAVVSSAPPVTITPNPVNPPTVSNPVSAPIATPQPVQTTDQIIPPVTTVTSTTTAPTEAIPPVNEIQDDTGPLFDLSRAIDFRIIGLIVTIIVLLIVIAATFIFSGSSKSNTNSKTTQNVITSTSSFGKVTLDVNNAKKELSGTKITIISWKPMSGEAIAMLQIQPKKTFTSAVTLTYTPSSEVLKNHPFDTLKIYQYQSETREWKALDVKADKSKKTISVEITTLGDYAVNDKAIETTD